MKLLIILILTFSLRSEAIETDKMAHIGISFMIMTGSYGVYKSVLDIPKLPAFLMAIGTTLLIGFIKERIDMSTQHHSFDSKDLLADVGGTGIAALTIIAFKF